MVKVTVEQDFDAFGDRMFKRAPGMCREAMADTLNHMANSARKHTGEVMDRYIDRPAPFTKNTRGKRGSMYVRSAKAFELVSETGFKDKQTYYLSFLIGGGERHPRVRDRVLIPVKKFRTNRHGNMPGKKKKLAEAIESAGDHLLGSMAAANDKSWRWEGSYFWGPPKGRPGAGEGLYRRSGFEGRDAAQKVFHAVPSADYGKSFPFQRLAVEHALTKFKLYATPRLIKAFEESRRR